MSFLEEVRAAARKDMEARKGSTDTLDRELEELLRPKSSRPHRNPNDLYREPKHSNLNEGELTSPSREALLKSARSGWSDSPEPRHRAEIEEPPC